MAGVVAITAIVGAIRGYSQQAFFLLCGIIALFIGLSFSRELAYFLPPSIKGNALRLACGFMVLFLITVILGRIIRYLLGKLLKNSQLTLLERFGGMLLGVMQGSIWLTAIVILAGLSDLPHSPWWKEAKILPAFQIIALWLKDHVPSDLLDTVHYR